MVQNEIKDGSVKPTCKSIIEFTIKSRDTFHARVLAKTKQPRVTSKFKNWLKIRRFDQSQDSSVNWDDVISKKEKDNQ